MQRFLLCMGGFAVIMAFGAVISLHLPWWISLGIVGVPIGLFVLVLVLPAWQRANSRRRSQVWIYVPIEQRTSPGQVTRPYREGETKVHQQ